MKIDSAAESLGRSVIRWTAAGDLAKVDEALETLSESPFRDEALAVYIAVDVTLIRSVFNGETPNEAQIRGMATDILVQESWTPLAETDVFECLASFVLSDYTPQVEPGRVPMAVFVIGSYLIANYSQSLGYEGFYDCLDGTLNALDAQPG